MSDGPSLANRLAIIGLQGRFPGCRDADGLWRLVRSGQEAITRFSEAELREAGIEPETARDPRYVAAGGVLDGVDRFDAPFFGYSPAEAAVLDPQQRLFLECAWAAFEEAGYDPGRIDGTVGVFGGAATNSYFFYYLFSRRRLLNEPGAAAAFVGADKDFLATRVSYKLGLQGPSLAVQTACSTSLVAVHLACQSLLSGECDVALAGGVSIRIPQTAGYFYQPQGILSPDGRCRAYDARAAGTVMGSGVGTVVLKRLEDALADGDPVRAVILGTAVNNDGAERVGYTAPSVTGQASVIGEALALAQIDPATVGYVEGHGSGTALGDPIEVAALNQVFGAGAGPASCGLGSVKTNIGHLDAAAGVAGLIKTVLALEHGELPPSLHFETPNPEIDFASGPFRVPTEAEPWPLGDAPRRAGVSSFGMGGTNAHVVLEEPPRREPSPAPPRETQLLVLSARSAESLERATVRLAERLREPPDAPLADVAYTLQTGRAVLPHRRALVCRSPEEGAAVLEGGEARRLLGSVEERRDRPVAFLLPGLGEDYPGMGAALYRAEPVFRREVDRCSEIVVAEGAPDPREHLLSERAAAGAAEGIDLRSMLGRGGGQGPGGGGEVRPPTVSQPALFTVEYALARTWESWGVRPAALLGYSLGEYVAACLGGVLGLEQGLRLVARRAALVETTPPGLMLAVPLAEDQVRDRLGDGVTIAAVNGPGLTVVAGPPPAVEALEAELARDGRPARRLGTGHAFHGPLMEPVADELRDLCRDLDPSAPRVPMLSNVSGTWLRDDEATDPEHWVRHLLRPVRFGPALEVLLGDPDRVLLEVGPGGTLGSLALQVGGAEDSAGGGRVVVPSLPGRHETRDEEEMLWTGAARLWLAGAGLDWQGVHGGSGRPRLRLPTYPFERRRHWVERNGAGLRRAAAEMEAAPAGAPPAAAEPLPVTKEMFEEEAPAVATLHGRPELGVAYEAPRTPTEEHLARMWSDILGIERVGVHDSFLELGGHSLLATRLVSRLVERYGVELTLAELFEEPTVAALATRLDARAPGSPEPASGHDPAGTGAIPRRDPSDPRPPLSFSQQRLWLIDRIDPEDTSYNIPNVLELRGGLDLPALCRGLHELVARHEVLRTTFADEDGRPYQEIHPPFSAGTPVAPPVADLSGLAGEARASAVRAAVVGTARRPFDLTRGPLMTTLLIRTGPDEHLFVVVLHHIVADGWSLGVFVRELATLYEAELDRRPADRALPPLPIQYADFALWQRRRLRGDRLEGLLEHWRRELDGAPRALELPTDRPRPARVTSAGRREPVLIDREVAEPLLRFCARAGATPFMGVLAAFHALLHRLTGETAIPVGSPIANRGREELEALIGFFTNTLVLVGDLSGDPGFEELLGRVRTTTLAAYDHQDLPFERLVEELEPERDLSRSPLFQVMLALQNAPRAALRAADLEIAPYDLDPGTSKFDLMLELTERPEGLGGVVEYDTDLFDRTTILRFVRHLETLIRAAADTPELPVSALPLLAPPELHQVVREWGADRTGSRTEAADETLDDLVAAAVEASPDGIALVADGRHWSYRELDRRADRIAAALGRAGAGPGAVVAVVMERSPEALAAILGTLRSGAAYLPVDPSDPPRRRETVLRDAGARVRLVGDGRVEGGAGRRSAGAGRPRALPDDLAYVIYTSGSTGRPKGVAMPHRPLVDLVRWQVAGSGGSTGGGAPTTCQFAPLGFDVSCQETLATWAAGGTLVLVPEGARREPDRLLRLLATHRVERLFLPFVALRLLCQEAADGPGLPPALREVITAGEQLRIEPPIRAAFRRSPRVRLENQYGPSETHVVTAHRLAPDAAPWPDLPPIGLPVAGATAAVVDPRLRAVPPGVTGELVLGGETLARGYLGRRALTAERFVPDPFSRRPGRRLYRTGDLARWSADGRLEFLGRADGQVKVRGYRIEPGEVEAVLGEHPGVVAAAVTAAGKGTTGRLVAFVVRREGAAPSTDELAEHLRERLPAYMVPGRILPIDALPTTASGKVDRRALPAPEAVDDGTDRPSTPPATADEQGLAAIWRELLGVGRVGVEDGFFELGGHSLLAAQLVSRVRSRLGVELGLRTVFERPTLGDLARAVAAGRGGAGGGETIPAVPRTGAGLPLSFDQERLWFLDRLGQGGAYHLAAALRIRGPLRLGPLAGALADTVARHEVLRTAFVEEDGEPVQRIGPPPAGPADRGCGLVDLTGLPAGRRRRALDALLADLGRAPFDLAAPAGGDLLRAVPVRLAPEEHALVLVIHHIAADGWSMPILVGEIVASYRARAEGTVAGLPRLPIQYADYAAWQRKRLSGERLEEGLRSWTGRLEGAPAELGLPFDRPPGTAASAPAGRVALRVPGPLTERLRSFAASADATLFMVLVAAYQRMLGLWAGRDDVLVGAPVANRTHREIEPLIGFFVNTLVLRGRLDGRPSFRELVERTRAEALDAFAHQEVPFERVVEALRPGGRGHRPLIQTVLTVQGAPVETPTLGGLSLEVLPLPPGRAKFDLTVELEEGSDGIAGTVEYPTSTLDRTTVLRWCGQLVAFLEGAAGRPDRPVDAVDVLLPGERQAVLVEWSDTGGTPEDASVVSRFHRQAERSPDAVALVEGGDHWTYRALERRAGRVAGRLRAAGALPGEPVGVLLDRSAGTVAVLLGVARAGCAYVPLDPSHPPRRLQGLVAEIGIGRVVTRRSLAEVADALGVQTIPAGGWLERAGAGDEEALAALEAAPVAGGDDLLYVMFTSGSTGRPKGVGATHRGVVRLLAEPTYATFGPGETLLHMAPLAFDASTLEIWGALLHGGRLAVAPAGPRSLAEIASLVTVQRITTLWITTGLFHQMVETEGEAVAGVRRVLTGGDVISPQAVERHLRRLRRSLPEGVLVNAYGPTEATTFTSCHPMRSEQEPEAPVPIGRPITDTRLRVTGPDLRPVPIGVEGELAIGGGGLARGYLGRPGRTAASFVPDPFSELPGARLYRTGDLVRLRADGELEFRGRIDTQVKVRGFRIEPGEVETALREHPEVEQAVVVLRGAPGRDRRRAGEERLVAYWVPRDGGGGGAAPDGPALRRFLRDALPQPAIPSVFVRLGRLPLTPNGKLDRAALPDPDRDGDAPAGRGERPAPSPTLDRILAIWQDVLRVDRVEPDDDFFDLGGHSLQATRLVARVRSTLDVDLPLESVFARPTPAGMSALVDGAGGGGEAADGAGRVDGGAGREAPLSFAQERLWFLSELAGAASAYNVPVGVELRGRLDLVALVGSLAAVVDRHEALRTRFRKHLGKPVQVVVPAGEALAEPPLPVVGLEGLDGPAGDRAAEEVRRLSRQETWTPFDLERGPVLRAKLVRLAPERHVLLVTMHHIVSDGWSAGVLVRELVEGYRALASGGRIDRPPLPVQYPEVARRQRRELTGEALREHLEFWAGHLDGAPERLELPTDRPRPPVADPHGASVRFRVRAEDAGRLRTLSRSRRASLFMVLTAAFQVVSGRWSGRSDPIVGSPIANRRDADLEPMIGFFVNTLAVRTDLGGEPTFEELVDRVRGDLFRAYRHQDLPFERLVDELVPRRSLDHHPICQVVLALQNAPMDRMELPGLELEPFDPSERAPAAKFDLTVTLHEADDGSLAGTVVYATALFDRRTAAAFAADYVALLEAAAAAPDRPIEALAPEVPARSVAGAGTDRREGVERLQRRDRTPRVEPGAEGAPPRSPLEERVAAIWAEVLGRDRIGIHDDFFDLGGHSLLATQAVARLRQDTGRDAPLEWLFEAPTVAGFAERLVAEEVERAAGEEGVDDLLDELDGLSEDEVDALLGAEEEDDA